MNRRIYFTAAMERFARKTIGYHELAELLFAARVELTLLRLQKILLGLIPAKERQFVRIAKALGTTPGKLSAC